MERTIKIGLVEDQLMFRQGIKSIIETWPEMKVTFESEDGFSVNYKLKTSLEIPDVMLVDLSLPPYEGREFSGLDLTLELSRDYPYIKVLILSVNNDEYFIAKLIENGASGYLTKDCHPDEVRDAILSMYSKGSYINQKTLNAIQNKLNKRIESPKENSILSRREIDVLKLVCQQMTAEEIGEKLFISPKTVNGHRNNLLQKTNSRNVTGLVMYAIKNKIVELI